MIKVEGLSKEFRSGRGHVQALNDISFDIATGTAAALYGKSGSGKTTLLNCLGGLERPEKGRIFISGQNILGLSSKELSLFQRKFMGFVFQKGNLLSYLNVFENIAFPLTLNGLSSREKERRVQELLEKIGLSGAGKALPHELSGGETQRVSVARAIAHSPALLLADEPTASLDTATGCALVKLMFEMGKENRCTMVISTHDLELIKLADKSIHIKDGEIVNTASFMPQKAAAPSPL